RHKGSRWFLQPLNSYRARRTRRPRLAVHARFAALAAISLVHQASLGLAARARLAARTGQTTRAARHLNLDLLRRIVPRHFQPDQRARRTWLTIAAITAIRSAASLAPSAPRRLTV